MSVGNLIPSTSPPPAVNFDRVARVYRWAEYLLLGPLLQRTRNHFLALARQRHQALILGDGDGRFLADLLRGAPALHALAVDTSAAMLHLLTRRCAFSAGRLTLLQSSVTSLPPHVSLAETDLVVTHFLLDCLTQSQVDALAQQLARGVKPGCLWLLSEFGTPTRQPWRTLGRLYIRALYLAFRLLTGLPVQQLPDHRHSLTAAGFRRIHHAARAKGLLYSEVWQVPGKQQIDPLATTSRPTKLRATPSLLRSSTKG